jgi:HNH endonuclease
MRRRKLDELTRIQVAKRANNRCEYCQVHEDDMFLAFEIDHIIAQKHGGGNEIDNLAYACPHCNQHKGTDMVTFVENYGDIVPLFNPRIDVWKEHFSTIEGEIISKTKIGYATIKLLKMNDVDLMILRKLLTELNRYT